VVLVWNSSCSCSLYIFFLWKKKDQEDQIKSTIFIQIFTHNDLIHIDLIKKRLRFLLKKYENYEKNIFNIILLFFSTNVFAAQTQIAQVNGMMCIKCQKMVTKALQAASPNATVKVSWPEGVAVSSFEDKSNLTDDDYKEAIAGTGFEVIKVVSVEKIITDAGEARKLVD